MTEPTPAAAHRGRRTAAAIAVGALTLAATAAFVRQRSRRAEERNPPRGRFLEVDGVRLHYVDTGRGEPVVLLHGNGVDLGDFALSGLLDETARRYRVVAFDRPGFGYSARPGDRPWAPEDQARLLRKALAHLEVERPVVVAHSFGTLVAAALALEQPGYVKGLVLLAGYYYPTARPDVPLAASLKTPLIGPLMRNTFSPLTGRALWPGARKTLFSPAEPPPRFAGFPVWMSLRPAQLRAAADDAAHMLPAARRLQRRYGELRLPVELIAGDGDRIARPDRHSQRLHQALPHSRLHLVPHAGHMVHYLAPAQILAAIDAVAAAGTETKTPRGGAS